MERQLDYAAVVTELHGWLGRHVAITVASADGRAHAIELGGILNRGEGPAVGLGELTIGSEILYFSVGSETAGEYCWLTLDESEFSSAWLTEPDDAGAGQPEPSLTMVTAGLSLAVSPGRPAGPS